jgi:hypothetical protein
LYEDIIHPKPLKRKKPKQKEIWTTCIGCDKLLRDGERCPTCNPPDPDDDEYLPTNQKSHLRWPDGEEFDYTP